MEIGLNYNLDLIEKVSDILANDFWVYEGFNASMIPVLSDPVKFSSNCSIFVRKGKCKIDIDLISYQITGPCIVNIRKSQILQVHESSEDFDSCFLVLSKRFCENLFILLQDISSYTAICACPVAKIPPKLLDKFNDFYHHISVIFNDSKDPFSYKAVVLAIASFFYECGYKCYSEVMDKIPKGQNRIPEKFISLVQQNFKKERFLDFYAENIGVTTKHLSRAVKSITGYTAVEWIDRYVVLEAKVLLRSTNLTIQQISDELSFASQSFFGKYFKKHTGMSPKEFRNS